MAILQIPSEYGYVLAACVSTFFVGAWHGGRVGGFRKAAKIPYPYEYASYEQVSDRLSPIQVRYARLQLGPTRTPKLQ
ncbi:unnamed protein product [Alternaria alternata]